ncbi:MAG: glycerate kinase [Candidatus Aminicenantes bacterium]|nr:glycerate kinase [Candidatus Aminicenantes bacterium]
MRHGDNIMIIQNQVNPLTEHRDLGDIFAAALDAVDSFQALARNMRMHNHNLIIQENIFTLHAMKRIVVVGAGKATAGMAAAVEAVLAERISQGLVIVKEGHAMPLGIIEVAEAAHPIPDERGVQGTRRVLQMVKESDEHTLILCLLSGGASALLVAPMAGLSLGDKQAITGQLLKAGASISELNTVRKHLSVVKGGKLAQAAFPARVIGLILSDVIGNRLDVIASGPTVPDPSTFADAVAVIRQFNLAEKIPRRAWQLLERGRLGREDETMKSHDPCFAGTFNFIIGDIGQALAAAREKARQLGYVCEILTAELQGDCTRSAHFLAQKALQARKRLQPGERVCFLSGGETTVTVKGNGQGGRNQELALAFALEIAGTSGIQLLSAGTDGTDGPTDAAGAIVDGTIAVRARELGLDPGAYLANNDSYTFFAAFDARGGTHNHLLTGPTGTNVMDVQIVLVQG